LALLERQTNVIFLCFSCLPWASAEGWDEGVMEMSLGEKAVLHISSEYGYGDQGAGGVIPPNASLDFEVELLQIGDQVADIPAEGCCAIL
jgi:hypothetical protein